LKLETRHVRRQPGRSEKSKEAYQSKGNATHGGHLPISFYPDIEKQRISMYKLIKVE